MERNSTLRTLQYVFVGHAKILLQISQIHFFAHLTSAQLISTESFAALLQSFTAVLDEFGVSHGRAKRAALCAAEGLMIVRSYHFCYYCYCDIHNQQAGAVLTLATPTFSREIISSIQVYTETTTSGKWIVQPIVRLHSPAVTVENADEVCLSSSCYLCGNDKINFRFWILPSLC